MKVPSIFKPNRKKIIILVVVALVGLFAFNFFLKPKPQLLQFAQVKKQDIKSTVSSSGTLTGKNSVNLKFKSGGKLAYLNVKVGDQVFAGQVVAGLDTQQLAIALQQATNSLRDKQAIVDKTLDDVKEHDKDETFTQRQNRTTAQVARDNAFDAVKEAQRAFQDVTIISPIAGIVTQTSPLPGQVVGSTDTIAQVVDFTQIFFDSDIDEADISKVSVGQKAEVSLDAYPDKIFLGEVSEIIPQTKTTSSGATVVTVRINMADLSITPINGLSGQASIILAQDKNVLTVPQEAIRDEIEVFVQNQQGLRPTKVKTGIKSDTDVEIKEGLKEGERVLLNPPASGTTVNQNRNPLQGIIFRVFGGSRGTGGFNRNR